MKNILVMLLVILLSACSHGPELQDAKGHRVRFSDYEGKFIVVNYWASWCKPCYEEVPELNAFYKKHQGVDVMMFGVNYDLGGNTSLRDAEKKVGVKYPTLAGDPTEKLGIDNVPGLPTTYVFNFRGKLIKRLLGKQTVRSLEDAIGVKQS